MAKTMVAHEPSEWSESNPGSELEQRVARLEEAVAGIVDTNSLEERVYERVHDKLKESAAALPPAPRPSVADPFDPGFPSNPVSSPLAPLIPAPAGAGMLSEMWRETRLFLRMMRDPLYHLTWKGKLLPLVALFWITIWPLISGWLPLIGKSLWFYPFDLVFAYLGLKAMGRELRRYEQHDAWRRRP